MQISDEKLRFDNMQDNNLFTMIMRAENWKDNGVRKHCVLIYEEIFPDERIKTRTCGCPSEMSHQYRSGFIKVGDENIHDLG